MPSIRKSADLRNHYAEISQFCHTTEQPVFITRNGEGDLAVMSIEKYDEAFGLQSLRDALAEGERDFETGNIVSEKEMMAHLDELIRK
jgi:prevent-host-death family protein